MAFLNSGATLRPILGKSQCWCVDGESKFVLKIANNAYYRIELPYKTTEEIQEVEKFKEVLTEILQYEQTPCPFARGFHVDLPDPPSTPVRKRPWRPRQRPGELDKAPEGDLIKAEGGEESNETKVKSTPLTSIPLPDVRFESEGHKTAAQPDDVVVAKSKLEHSDEENDSEATDDTGSTLKDITVANQAVHGMIETPTRPRPAKTEIAVADPPQLSLKTVSPPKTTKPIPMPLEVNVESSSLSSSTDSFHSFHSPISPLLPSPPFEDSSIAATDTDYEDVNVPRTRVHQRANSKSTLDPPIPWDIPCADTNTGSYSPDLPETPPLLSDDASQCEEPWSEVKTPSPTTELRQRRKVVSRHGRPATQSPLLSPSNLRSPTGPLSGHHFTTALLQKTCTLLLGPPVQLVALMLNIASKIARGAFRGSTFGYGESGVKIPCSWDFSDADDEGSEEVWDEDDYGVSLGIIERKERVKREAKGWEID